MKRANTPSLESEGTYPCILYSMEQSPQKALLPEGYAYHTEGYLWFVLPVETFAALPETVIVGNNELRKKTEFHVTVVNARRIARDIAGEDTAAVARAEAELQSLLSEYIQDAPIEFLAFDDDLRLATTPERKSIAARCRMKNIEGYFERIAAEYGKKYPLQPPHVSLYTSTGAAIGINSIEEMESFEKVEVPEVQSILNLI